MGGLKKELARVGEENRLLNEMLAGVSAQYRSLQSHLFSLLQNQKHQENQLITTSNLNPSPDPYANPNPNRDVRNNPALPMSLMLVRIFLTHSLNLRVSSFQYQSNIQLM